MEAQSKFYLGRIFQDGATGSEPLLYDADDLVTHAVIVGMTGSGKTGLCINLMEEAAMNGLPALMIDPKGDLTNTLLHFPGLLPQDFQPWVNADAARRAGKSLDEAAQDAASSWQEGLNNWGIPIERLEALKQAAHFAVFTPGSEAGLPVNILASLKAPTPSAEAGREALLEKISGTVTALLGLVGIQNLDPVRSREHILLSRIFETAWSQGQDLDLGGLILQTQAPPFQKLGVFEVDAFFPPKDRFELAMLLNNILAAPSFATWIEGEPLDIPSLLFSPDGRPRHSVFYIAHLSDTERMFFVTLLFSAVEAWMRSQTGSTSLRALLYFDEISGYLPPVANPPVKMILLRMLKQARAFGVGLVLVSQNPVDLDYKALSNAGTWMIGKLQTDQDKQRLLDGLQGALSGEVDRGIYDRLLSSLGKRVFLLNDVHRPAGEPLLFQTRWTMNYLAGPLTRTQIPALNRMAGAVVAAPPAQPAAPAPAHAPAQAPVPAVPPTPERPAPAPAPQPAGAASPSGYSASHPAVPEAANEYFLPVAIDLSTALRNSRRPAEATLQFQGLVYHPSLFIQAVVRYINRKYGLDYERRQAIQLSAGRRGQVRWDDFKTVPVEHAALQLKPVADAYFAALEAPLGDARALAALQKDFLDWLYRTDRIAVSANDDLKVYAGPETSPPEFKARCLEAARQACDAETNKLLGTYDKKLGALQAKVAKAQQAVAEDKSEVDLRKTEETSSGFETLAGMIGLGRKRSLTSTLDKHRMTEQARARLQESNRGLAELQKQLAALENEKTQAVSQIVSRWQQVAGHVSEVPLTAQKKDISIDIFGIIWLPYHLVKIGTEQVELPAYTLAEA